MKHVALGISPAQARAMRTQADMASFVADVSAEIDERTRNNINNAAKMASALRELATAARALMSSPLAVDPGQGPTLVAMYNAASLLAACTPLFQRAVDAFVKEHGALIEKNLIEQLDEVCAWTIAWPERLRPQWSAYTHSVDDGLDACAEEYKADAAAWSAVDGDGLVDD